MRRPTFRHESLFLYLFLQITFLARCHYPSGPRVTSLVAIRNQPHFLKQKRWMQKGWSREKVVVEGVEQRKGGCNRSGAEKRWLRQRSWKRQIQKEKKERGEEIFFLRGRSSIAKSEFLTAERDIWAELLHRRGHWERVTHWERETWFLFAWGTRYVPVFSSSLIIHWFSIT